MKLRRIWVVYILSQTSYWYVILNLLVTCWSYLLVLRSEILLDYHDVYAWYSFGDTFVLTTNCVILFCGIYSINGARLLFILWLYL